VPEVTITVEVQSAAFLPKVEVLAGLDQNADGIVADSEIVPVMVGSDGKFTTTLPAGAGTSSWWIVIIKAPHNSTYTVSVSSGDSTVPGNGAVGPSNHASMYGTISA
jgi:hypothetical protein